MKTNKNFVLRDMGTQYVAVPVGKSYATSRRIIKLNDSAKFIWDALNAGKTEMETVADMVETYQITEERAAAAYSNAVQRFVDVGMLDE